MAADGSLSKCKWTGAKLLLSLIVISRFHWIIDQKQPSLRVFTVLLHFSGAALTCTSTLGLSGCSFCCSCLIHVFSTIASGTLMRNKPSTRGTVFWGAWILQQWMTPPRKLKRCKSSHIVMCENILSLMVDGNKGFHPQQSPSCDPCFLSVCTENMPLFYPTCCVIEVTGL